MEEGEDGLEEEANSPKETYQDWKSLGMNDLEGAAYIHEVWSQVHQRQAPWHAAEGKSASGLHIDEISWTSAEVRRRLEGSRLTGGWPEARTARARRCGPGRGCCVSSAAGWTAPLTCAVALLHQRCTWTADAGDTTGAGHAGAVVHDPQSVLARLRCCTVAPLQRRCLQCSVSQHLQSSSCTNAPRAHIKAGDDPAAVESRATIICVPGAQARDTHHPSLRDKASA